MILSAAGMKVRRIAVNPEIAAMDTRMLALASVFPDARFVRMFASQRLEQVMAYADAKSSDDK
ncbi:MAG: hypothetical protein ACK4NS_01275 [Saprospiraceae bacterium]